MTDLGDLLAFHVQYGLKEIGCAEAGCDVEHEEHIVHRTHSGEATLTLAGPAQLIREAAALVFPDLAKVFNPPPAEQPMAEVHRSHRLGAPGPFDSRRCERCGHVVVSANGTTPMGAAQCPIGVTAEDRKALSATVLDAMLPGMAVIAGGFPDHLRNEPVLWVKLHSGRWETARQERIDDNPGVSSTWLANNRHPMLDTSS